MFSLLVRGLVFCRVTGKDQTTHHSAAESSMAFRSVMSLQASKDSFCDQLRVTDIYRRASQTEQSRASTAETLWGYPRFLITYIKSFSVASGTECSQTVEGSNPNRTSFFFFCAAVNQNHLISPHLIRFT